ncbi:MAG: hypothetical protein ABSH31_00890 [Bryobacteraceae bacterium]
MANLTHRWLLNAVLGLSLACVSCGSKTDFDAGAAKDILEASAVNLDGEQVTITQPQLDCGVQSELWEAPVQVSQDRTTARLTAKGRGLNFGDDPAIESHFHRPYAQVRGAFSLEVDEVSGVRDGEDGTKLVDAKAGIKLQDACFPSALPLMGVKHGEFREDTPVSFLFRRSDQGWSLEKVVH